MIDEDESVDVSTEITIDEMPKLKQRRKSSRDKNVDRIITKAKDKATKKRHSTALEEGVRLMNYADRISKKLNRNHNYIKKEIVCNPDFEKLLKIRAIIAQVNKTLQCGDKPVAKTTLLRYHTVRLDKWKPIGAPLIIPMNLLNTMQLHIKVQQLSKQG